MIPCYKCGFGHKTEEEYQACKSWPEMVAECQSLNHPIVRRDWHSGEYEYCTCGQNKEPRLRH